MLCLDSDSSRNSTALTDISNLNMTSADSSMTNAEAKKMALLAMYKQSQNDVTPRTAINQFLDANKSQAQTPALFFDKIKGKRQTRKRSLSVDESGREERSLINSSKVEDMESSNISSDNSELVMSRNCSVRRSSRGKKPEITMEDLDPERDITKPTNLSTTVNVTNFNLTDDSADSSALEGLNRRRKRGKVKNKNVFSADDFNVTANVPKNVQSSLRREETMSNTLVQMNDNSLDESLELNERMAKKRKMLEKKMARQKQKPKWDFSGIEPPSPTIRDVSVRIEKMPDLSEETQAQVSKINETAETNSPLQVNESLQQKSFSLSKHRETSNTLTGLEESVVMKKLRKSGNVSKISSNDFSDVLTNPDPEDQRTTATVIAENCEKEYVRAESDPSPKVDESLKNKSLTLKKHQKTTNDLSSFEETILMKKPKKKSNIPKISVGDFSDLSINHENEGKGSEVIAENDDLTTLPLESNQSKDKSQREGNTSASSSRPVASEELPLSLETSPESRSAFGRKKSKVASVNVSDFNNLSANKSQTKTQFPPLVNTPSPSSRKITNMAPEASAQPTLDIPGENEETIEEIANFVQSTSLNSTKPRRKSVYEAGIPKEPTDYNLTLEQTRAFRPDIESTRIGNISNNDSLAVKSPIVTNSTNIVKPGRDTSTPYQDRSIRGGLRNRGLSKTEMVQPIAENEEAVKMNKTTVINPQLPTPQIVEVIREARKSGVRSMRVSMYERSKFLDDIIDGGTQTSPGLGQDDQGELVVENIEAGCQVTPGVDVTNATKLKSINRTSKDMSSSEPDDNGTELLDTSKQARNNDELFNSLIEEVDIHLPNDEVDNVGQDLDITSSGRKNPSPVIERRNETVESQPEPADQDESNEEGEEKDANAQYTEKDKIETLTNVVSEEDDENLKDVEYENVDDEVDLSSFREGQDVDDGTKSNKVNEIDDHPRAMEEADEEDVTSRSRSENLPESQSEDPSLDYLQLPSASLVKSVPNSQERKEMRQATLSRYLGVSDSTSLSPLVTPAVTPEKVQQEPKKLKPIKRKPRAGATKSIIPEKNIKFEYHRFSRYKLKPEADKTLVQSSQDFLLKCMERMSTFAEERGSEKIHLCDIKRMMVECGFVTSGEDPQNRTFNRELREVAKPSQIKELIPASLYGVSGGDTYPPRDIWDVKGGKKSKSKKVVSSSSVGSRKSISKADKVKRLKVIQF